jgi:hypothetical protein
VLIFVAVDLTFQHLARGGAVDGNQWCLPANCPIFSSKASWFSDIVKATEQ